MMLVKELMEVLEYLDSDFEVEEIEFVSSDSVWADNDSSEFEIVLETDSIVLFFNNDDTYIVDTSDGRSAIIVAV